MMNHTIHTYIIRLLKNSNVMIYQYNFVLCVLLLLTWISVIVVVFHVSLFTLSFMYYYVLLKP